MKAFPPKKVSMSPVGLPVVTNKMYKALDQMKAMIKRMPRGRELVVLHIAGLVRKYVQDKAPVIDKSDYSQDLKIGLIPKVDGGVGSIIYYDKTFRKLEENEPDNVVYVLLDPNKTGTPKYMSILAKYNPWPMDLLPIALSLRDSDNTVKKVSTSEMQKLRRRIISSKRKIEGELKSNGLTGAEIKSDSSFVNTEVYDDIAFTVLRYEFGYQLPQIPHWRPALSKLSKDLKAIEKKFITYIETGNEGIFEIPVYDKKSASDLDADNRFQELVTKGSTLK